MHRYIPRPPEMQVPPYWHGFGEQLFMIVVHRGRIVFAGQSQRKPNVPTGLHVPPFWHGFRVQPSNVELERMHPNGPIPFPVVCGGHMHVTENKFRTHVADG